MATQNIQRYPNYTTGHSELSNTASKNISENSRLVRFSVCDASRSIAQDVCHASDVYCALLQAEREEELLF